VFYLQSSNITINNSLFQDNYANVGGVFQLN